jgi:deazaflavin-dependent oxidoreductase (nitroreductase family)
MRICLRRFVFMFLVLGLATFGSSAARRDRLIRQFNKHILNPGALWIVARRRMYYGVMHHVGRRSGRMYSTPVVAKLTPEGIIIPLPYGPNTDWCRNVLAAGHATLTLDGAEYAIDNPTIVGADVAGPLVPAATARTWKWLGIDNYLRLDASEIEGANFRVAA